MKRLVAFLVLLGLGLLALKFAIGDEAAVRANGGGESRKQPAQPPSNVPGVKMGTGGVGATVSQKGSLNLPRWRDVPLGNGRVRREQVSLLQAEDSKPIGEGLQQLIGITLKLFDKGQHVATLRASDAFVELGRDANGQPVIDEQKAIDLRDAVLVTEDDSELAGMRLELGQATVHVGDNEVLLTTPREQPVKLTIAGEHEGTLTGIGATARLPRNKGGGLRKADVEILADPVLVTDDIRLQAKGRMHYIEDTATGAAQITVDDDVVLELLRGSLSLGGRDGDVDAGGTEVRGDQFTGWLQRNSDDRDRDGAGRSMVWQRMLLVGAPAIVDSSELRVITPRISVLPGPSGEPYVVSAHGGESRIEQVRPDPRTGLDERIVGVSPRRIHLIRPGEGTGALHRRMGFPAWTLRPLTEQQVIVFEGASKLSSGSRELSASDGLVAIGRPEDRTGAVRGFGQIAFRDEQPVERQDGLPGEVLTATGSDGMFLVASPTGERLVLGPEVLPSRHDWREHRYTIDYGDARVRGLGGCTVTRSDERTTLDLLAPHDEIEADLDRDDMQLRSLRQLHATVDGHTLSGFDIGGLPATATFERAGERLRAQAPRLVQTGPRSLQLLPMKLAESPWTELTQLQAMPRLRRTWTPAGKATEHTVEVFGPRIDVHHAGGNSAIVDAHRDETDVPRLYARLQVREGAEPTTVTCGADRLRVLPFLLPEVARRLHFGGATGPIPDLVMRALSQPWLLVDGVHDFELDDDEQGHVEGVGDRLLVSQGGAGALFLGHPDEQTPAVVTRTHDNRTVRMSGARVRVENRDGTRLSAIGSFEGHSTFLPPTMTLHEPGASGLLSHMRAVCRGNIDVDSKAIRFGGPVEAYAITPTDDVVPGGLQIDARGLQMTRSPTTGEVVLVDGTDVIVDWTRLRARADKVQLDLVKTLCTASDPRSASVVMPDGRHIRAQNVSVNYVTWSVRMGAGSAVQPDGDRDRTR